MEMRLTTREKLEILIERVGGPYEAYLYDCDGTLADNMAAHKAAYVHVARVYGIEIDPAIIDETAGWPTVRVAELIKERYHKQFDPIGFALSKSAFFIEEYIRFTKPIAFVVQHLLGVYGKAKIAVVTGGKRTTVSKTIEVLGIQHKIDLMVCAHETERGKPYPDPFLEAARQLGVEPKNCIVFEDGLPGQKAAEAAGMKCIRVDDINRM